MLLATLLRIETKQYLFLILSFFLLYLFLHKTAIALNLLFVISKSCREKPIVNFNARFLLISSSSSNHDFPFRSKGQFASTEKWSLLRADALNFLSFHLATHKPTMQPANNEWSLRGCHQVPLITAGQFLMLCFQKDQIRYEKRWKRQRGCGYNWCRELSTATLAWFWTQKVVSKRKNIGRFKCSPTANPI